MSSISEERGDSEGQYPGKNVIVLISGNPGLVSGTRPSERSTPERTEQYYPWVLEGLAQHEAIHFVLARPGRHAPVVIRAEGSYYLEDERVKVENPHEQ